MVLSNTDNAMLLGQLLRTCLRLATTRRVSET